VKQATTGINDEYKTVCNDMKQLSSYTNITRTIEQKQYITTWLHKFHLTCTHYQLTVINILKVLLIRTVLNISKRHQERYNLETQRENHMFESCSW